MKQLLLIALATLLFTTQGNAQIRVGTKKQKQPTAEEILQHVKANEKTTEPNELAPLYSNEETQQLLTQIADAKTIDDLPVIKTRLTALKTDFFSIDNFTDEITDEQYTGWQITGEIRRGDVFEVYGLYNLPTPVKQGEKADLNDLCRRAKYYSAVLVTPDGVNADAKFMPRHFSNAFSYGTEEKIWDAYTHRYDVLVQRAEYQANKQ